MITETRSYIKTQIAAVNSDLTAFDDPFGTIDVFETDIDNKYKILFEVTALEKEGNHAIETFPVAIELYRTTCNRDITDDFDLLFDNAIQIRNKIVNIKDVKANTNFYEALPVSFTPESLEGNQRIIKITIGINFFRAVAFC